MAACYFAVNYIKMISNRQIQIHGSDLSMNKKEPLKYQSADLPLNDRGAVYHSELADTVLTVGDPARVEAITQHFDSIELTRSHREFVTQTGRIGSNRVSVLSTGIGPANLDIVMSELDALVNMDLKTRTPLPRSQSLKIIRVGTTGGLQPESPPGAFFVSRLALGFDSLLYYYEGSNQADLHQFHQHAGQFLQESSSPFYVAKASEDLTIKLESIGRRSITATFGGFYGPQGRELRVPLRYPGLLEQLSHYQYQDLKVENIEMETASMLGLGGLMGHQCASISVALANRKLGTFTRDTSSMVDKLIKTVLDILPEICACTSKL